MKLYIWCTHKTSFEYEGSILLLNSVRGQRRADALGVIMTLHRQTDRQIDRQEDGQTDTMTDRRSIAIVTALTMVSMTMVKSVMLSGLTRVT